MWSIGRELDLIAAEPRRSSSTSRMRAWLNIAAGGDVGLTHAGVCAVEDTMREPEAARECFPEISVIAVGVMINSQIQQRARNATRGMDPQNGREMNIRQKDEQRLAFLHRLYELVDGSTSRMVAESEVGSALGFGEETTDEVVDYLSDQYLVEGRAFGGMIGITAYGVKEVEDALRGPREGTEHFTFPVINNVLIADRDRRLANPNRDVALAADDADRRP